MEYLGKSKDIFKEFKRSRNAHITVRERETERITNKIKLISFNLGSSSNQEGSWWKKQSGNSLNVEQEDLENAIHCALCKRGFGKYFGKGKQIQCPICSRVVCKDCSSHKLSLEQTRSAQAQVEIPICDSCNVEVARVRLHKEIQSKVQNVDKVPLVAYHKLLKSITNAIDEDKPKLKQILVDIGDVHTEENDKDIQIAKRIDADVSSLFQNFESALKKLDTLQVSMEREKKLLANVKAAFLQYFQDNYAEFKVLSKQLKTISDQPIQKGIAINTNKILSSPRGNSIQENKFDNIPRISGINPAALSLKGGRITITGSNFAPKVQVMIENTPVPCKYVDSTEIIIEAPGGVAEFKSIRLTNPDGSFALLEKMLLYSPDLNLETTEAIDIQKFSSPVNFMTIKNQEAKKLTKFSEFGPTRKPVEDPPTIDYINPVVSPLTGISMEISGTNFIPGETVLLIDGKEVPLKTVSSTLMQFWAPPMKTEGFKTVLIRNPNKKECMIENVLLYSDAMAVATSKPEPVAPKNNLVNPSRPKSQSMVNLLDKNATQAPTISPKTLPTTLLSSRLGEGEQESIKAQSPPKPKIMPPTRVWGKPQ